MAHVLLKPDLGNFEYYFGKVEMSAIAQEFEHSLAIAFLWDWNENKNLMRREMKDFKKQIWFIRLTNSI